MYNYLLRFFVVMFQSIPLAGKPGYGNAWCKGRIMLKTTDSDKCQHSFVFVPLNEANTPSPSDQRWCNMWRCCLLHLAPLLMLWMTVASMIMYTQSKLFRGKLASVAHQVHWFIRANTVHLLKSANNLFQCNVTVLMPRDTDKLKEGCRAIWLICVYVQHSSVPAVDGYD